MKDSMKRKPYAFLPTTWYTRKRVLPKGRNLAIIRSNSFAHRNPNSDIMNARLCAEFFGDISPILLVMGIYGILPVTVKPLRVMFHPWRSTVVYAILANILVLWSGTKTVCMRWQEFMSPHSSVDRRLLALTSVMHCLGIFLMPILWVESRTLKKRSKLWADFAYRYGHLITKRERHFSWLVWAFPFYSFVISPLFVLMWVFLIAREGGHYSHIIIHSFQHLFLYAAGACFSINCIVLKDIASELSKTIVEAENTGKLDLEIVKEIRNAWMMLSDMITDVSGLPVTSLAFVLYLILMCFMGTYHTIIITYLGYYHVALAMGAIAILIFSSLGLICNSAYKLTRAAGPQFAHTLQRFSVWNLDVDVNRELQTFLLLVSWDPPKISLCGFTYLTRTTFSSVIVIIATYLVVLVQFRQGDMWNINNTTGTEHSNTGN